MDHLRIALLALLATGCSSSGRGSDLQTWGELRDVLRNQQSEGRVALSEAARPGLYGLGAVAGLEGEVLVHDGEVWVSRAASSEAVSPAGPPSEDLQATLLVLAEVRAWDEISLPGVSDLDGLEEELRGALGSGSGSPSIFMVEGAAASLELHVLNGACPFAVPAPPPQHEPYRARLDRVDVLLVGVWAEDSAGVLTHHGSQTHIHVLTGGSQPIVGHVDGLRLLEGARLRVARP